MSAICRSPTHSIEVQRLFGGVQHVRWSGGGAFRPEEAESEAVEVVQPRCSGAPKRVFIGLLEIAGKQ